MSFNGISRGDGICQVLRSGSCFTLMYFDKNCLKIDPEITRETMRGGADPRDSGSLGVGVGLGVVGGTNIRRVLR